MNKLEFAMMTRDFINQLPYGVIEFRENELIVLPTVSPPGVNTPLLSELIEKLASKFLEKNSQCRVFEMGVGAGAAILTVAKMKGVIASASDIAPMAVLNTKANALWWGIQCDIYQGNLFENVPEGEFDIIFWNIPFFKEDPGGIEDVRFRVGFDPGYKYLKQFLADANNYLAKNGQILLGVDHNVCDLDGIYKLLEEAGFNSEVYKEAKIRSDEAGFNSELYKEAKIICEEMEFSFAFLLLTKKV